MACTCADFSKAPIRKPDNSESEIAKIVRTLWQIDGGGAYSRF